MMPGSARLVVFSSNKPGMRSPVCPSRHACLAPKPSKNPAASNEPWHCFEVQRLGSSGHALRRDGFDGAGAYTPWHMPSHTSPTVAANPLAVATSTTPSRICFTRPRSPGVA
eukprot:gene1820-biopygen989